MGQFFIHYLLKTLIFNYSINIDYLESDCDIFKKER